VVQIGLMILLRGADWIDDSVAEKLEEIVNLARKRHHIVEVADWQYEFAG